MDQLPKKFPPGVHYTVAFNTTDFVEESISEVVMTLLLSIVLVVLVIYVFLQNPRSTLIPAATIPVSLIGTFFVMKIFGFTINTITLFGLTLATGLVVDDAIVVIENIARHIEMNKGKQSGVASAAEAMREIQSAVVASSLVLLAVFIPVAFFPGTTGQLYKQFALTIAAAITISLFQALTLAPVLSARLLTGDVESTVHLLPLVQRRARAIPASGTGRAAARDSVTAGSVMGVFALALAADALHVREDADRLHSRARIRATSSCSCRRRKARRCRARRRSPKRPRRSFAASRKCSTSSTSAASASPARRPTAASCSACSSRGASAKARGDGNRRRHRARSTTPSSSRFRRRRSSRSIRRRSTASAASAASSSNSRTAATSGCPR